MIRKVIEACKRIDVEKNKETLGTKTLVPKNLLTGASAAAMGAGTYGARSSSSDGNNSSTLKLFGMERGAAAATAITLVL
jgi:hypothetical protein